METIVLEHLRRLRTLLATPDKWTKEVHARDANGTPVFPESPSAVRWCIVGGIDKVAYGDDTTIATMRLQDESPGRENLSSWNDDPDRTHKDVLDLIDAAIHREADRIDEDTLDLIAASTYRKRGLRELALTQGERNHVRNVCYLRFDTTT